MHNNSFFKSILFFVSIVLFASCDKDYSTVGDALIGENHFDLVKYPSNVVAYNEKITPIESNNLPVNPLGIYDNPAFGKTTASFVTQLSLATLNPTIGKNPVVESVYLDIPYFVDATQTKPIASTTIGVTAGNTYVLDSIYGEKLAKIKLSIYESGRDMDNQNGKVQKFYTNQNAEFDSFKIGNRLNSDTADKSQNDEFFFNPTQNSIKTKDAADKETISYSTPSMRLKLNAAFFQNKIFNAPSGALADQDVFDKYFRGLYFKVEQSGSDKGSLAMINFAKGTLTINYKEDKSASDAARVDKTLALNLFGKVGVPFYTASLLENSNPNTDYDTATSSPNRVLGDQKLFLKGGEGSLAVLELFEKKDLIGYDANGNLTGPNKVSDELDKMRKEGWLINDAKLVFNIDASLMADSSFEPDRIFVYDFDTKGRNGYNIIGSGDITKGANKKGVSYTVRISEYISYLVKNKSVTNVKLGLAVRGFKDGDVIFNELQLPVSLPFTQAPKASVMNPLGTILYGSNLPDTDANYSKRLKLEIYYTKPK
ncbi:MAG: DUF4270 domain-containing protein [Flavobacteriaceae bacterium]|nr:DUF4270 domain-containing protein [Flavobacteriaceae bacterium]